MSLVFRSLTPRRSRQLLDRTFISWPTSATSPFFHGQSFHSFVAPCLSLARPTDLRSFFGSHVQITVDHIIIVFRTGAGGLFSFRRKKKFKTFFSSEDITHIGSPTSPGTMLTLRTLALALVASLATTAQAGTHWQRRHPYPEARPNNATAAVGPSAMIVYTTSVATITSCPASVTNCPTGYRSLSTTIIPVLTTMVGTGTAVRSPPPSTAVSAVGNSTTTVTTTDMTDATLTYVLGTGSSTTLVTTTVHVKTTRVQTSVGVASLPRRCPSARFLSSVRAPGQVRLTEAQTMYAAPSASDAAPVGAGPSSVVDAAATSLATTLESTSTQYLTVSAVPVNSAADSTPMSKPVVNAVATGGDGGDGGSGSSASACAPPSTVTVTAQQVVTVVSVLNPTTSSSRVPFRRDPADRIGRNRRRRSHCPPAPYPPPSTTGRMVTAPKPTRHPLSLAPASSPGRRTPPPCVTMAGRRRTGPHASPRLRRAWPGGGVHPLFFLEPSSVVVQPSRPVGLAR